MTGDWQYGGGRILFLAQLPPPVHGLSVMSQLVYNHMVARGWVVEQRSPASARKPTDVGSKSADKIIEFAGLLLWMLGSWYSPQRYELAYLTFTPWSHAVLRDGLIAWLARRLSRRVIVHIHTEGLTKILEGGGIKNAALRQMLSGCEVIAITDEGANVANDSGIFSEVHHLSNTAKDPGRGHANARKQSGAGSPTPIRCAYLANYDKRKGIFDFIFAIAVLHKAGIPVTAVIMGAETRHVSDEQVLRAVGEAGLDDTIQILGFADDVTKDRVFRDCDLLIYPTRHDHSPLVIIEALSYGVVPITLDAGGIRSMLSPSLSHNVYDHTAPVNEIREWLVARVRNYYESGEELEQDKCEARAIYTKHFSPSVFEKGLDEILFEVDQNSIGA